MARGEFDQQEYPNKKDNKDGEKLLLRYHKSTLIPRMNGLDKIALVSAMFTSARG